MTRQQLRALVCATLAQIAPEAELDTLPDDVDLREELDMDSMDYLNFMIGLNEATGVEIPERDYARLATLDGCVEYLAARTGVP